ncbi:hypothetical protein F7725_014165 [Dissostichus mawsoni]|uniref:Uncharacterized protein n=1 Tax=Dissostichus mawsoni TaxID=36200 RepID=A0A7J5YYA5_DISMA|nr:hypothetical protein F7725_014165 [Dissostichus mawsoni]
MTEGRRERREGRGRRREAVLLDKGIDHLLHGQVWDQLVLGQGAPGDRVEVTHPLQREQVADGLVVVLQLQVTLAQEERNSRFPCSFSSCAVELFSGLPAIFSTGSAGPASPCFPILFPVSPAG